MSHISDIALRILAADMQLEAMKEAVGNIEGLEFRENQKTYKVYYNRAHCDHAIGVKGDSDAFEIGLVKEGDEYQLKSDFFGQRRLLQLVGGAQCDRLKREYAAALALKKAKAKLAPKGFVAQARQDLEGGRIRLRLVRR
jgi:hypothetical protein